MAWGRLEDTFHDEPKFYRLATKLNISFAQAAGHVACLWSWAHRHAIDGDLRDHDNQDIARAAKWDGPPDVFVQILSSENVRLLDQKGDFYIIHNFAMRAEARKAAKKKAKWRVSRDSPPHVANMSTGRREEKRREEKRDLNTPLTYSEPKLEREDVEPVRQNATGDMSHIATLTSDNIHYAESANKNHKSAITKPTRKNTSPGVSPPGVTVEIREAWKAAFEKRYPGQSAAWGKREGGQAKNLLGTFSKTELLKLVEYFFAWKKPEIIRAGHPFGTGPNSFVMKIHELRADIADVDRRKEAAQIQEREKLTDKLAVEADGVNRINALMAQGELDEQRRVEKSNTANAGAITQGDHDASGSTRETLERPSDDGLVQVDGEARNQRPTMASFDDFLRVATDAVNRRSKIAFGKQSPRMPTLSPDEELDRLGEGTFASCDEELPF